MNNFVDARPTEPGADAVTPCDTSVPNLHFENGGALYATANGIVTQNGRIKLFVTETVDGSNPAQDDFRRVLMFSSPNGATGWSSRTFLKRSPVFRPGVGPSEIGVANVELVQATANTNWWGVFHWRWLGEGQFQVGRLRVVMDDANPNGYVISILAADGVTWSTVADDGTFAFAPWAMPLSGPVKGIVNVDGEWQLWSTWASTALDGCEDDGPHGSTFTYRTISQTGPIGPLRNVFSTVRPMPSNHAAGRLLPWRVNDPNGARLVFSSSKERATCSISPDPPGMRGSEIILTVVNNSEHPSAPVSAKYYTITPCRVLDTREGAGTPLSHGAQPIYRVGGSCGIPMTARAVAVNVTAVNPTGSGMLTIVPGDVTQIFTTTVSYRQGSTRAVLSQVGLAVDGSASLRAWNVLDAGVGSVHLIIDAMGYYQ